MNNHNIAQTTREMIANQAYTIWETEGRPDGLHEVHWFRAESQLVANHAQDERPSPAAEAVSPKIRRKSSRRQT